ncbi:MAG: hypothetical protein HY537_05830 [Deltaproteobacteria bacterium]|nr:hypothetical protein [Deltaproteobacteria bacterium]
MGLIVIKIERDNLGKDKAIFGTLMIERPFGPGVSYPKRWYTLERPWIENLKVVSCIPAGRYPAHIRRDHDPWRIELENTGNRTNIQIHNGTILEHIEGCILVGTYRTDSRVKNSVTAMAEILGETLHYEKSPQIVVNIIDHLQVNSQARNSERVTS